MNTSEHMIELTDLLVDSMEEEHLLGINAMPLELSMIILFFFCLFLVGFAGNITVIYRLIRTRRQCVHIYGKGGTRRISLHRYVLLLACVDFLVTLMILMLIPYFIYGEWLIGGVLCKVFWTVDQMNKILSIHILTGMAIERYFIVRQSVGGPRSKASRLVPIGFYAFTGVTLLLVCPLISNVTLDTTTYPGGIEVTTCVSPMTDQWIELMTAYMMVLGYVIPALIVSYCYGMLVRMLQMRYKLANMVENSRTNLVHKVSKSILYVTAFHFACWTPYWLVTLLPILDNRWWHIGLDKRYQYYYLVQICSTALPYVNSAFNWCFYVLLNHCLRKQIFRRSSSPTSIPTHRNGQNRDDHSPTPMYFPIERL